jgi:DNA-binding winged helix-turn-helix (wHTH) protein
MLLLESPGELVSREDLQRKVWGTDIDTDLDHSLKTAINKIREALKDSADNPRFIETLPRRGYRFIAPVTVLADKAEINEENISVPSYPPSIAPEVPVQQPVPEHKHRPQRSDWKRRPAPLLTCLGILGMLGIIWYVWSSRAPTLDILWSTLFQPRCVTYIVPGDAGMKLYTNMAHRIVSVSEYASRSYLTTPPGTITPDGNPASGTLAVRRYTTMSDVKLIAALLRLPHRFSDRMQICFAREFNFNYLKTGNVILIGAPEANPWVQVFDTQVDFSVIYGQSYTVLNRKPKANEPRTYPTIENGGTRHSYAVISLTSNPGETGHALLIEGASMDEIEAATDFLLNPEKMSAVLAAAKGRNGQLHPFDLLLQTTSYNGGSLDAKLSSLHLHP